MVLANLAPARRRVLRASHEIAGAHSRNQHAEESQVCHHYKLRAALIFLLFHGESHVVVTIVIHCFGNCILKFYLQNLYL